jgi:hypothetical protein
MAERIAPAGSPGAQQLASSPEPGGNENQAFDVTGSGNNGVAGGSECRS